MTCWPAGLRRHHSTAVDTLPPVLGDRQIRSNGVDEGQRPRHQVEVSIVVYDLERGHQCRPRLTMIVNGEPVDGERRRQREPGPVDLHATRSAIGGWSGVVDHRDGARRLASPANTVRTAPGRPEFIGSRATTFIKGDINQERAGRWARPGTSSPSVSAPDERKQVATFLRTTHEQRQRRFRSAEATWRSCRTTSASGS